MAHLPQVDARLGAPLGRPDRFGHGAVEPLRFSLQRVRLTNGGYDAGGAYWGLGPPLYWASSACGEVERFFRATDHAAAKAEVRRMHPGCKFYR